MPGALGRTSTQATLISFPSEAAAGANEPGVQAESYSHRSVVASASVTVSGSLPLRPPGVNTTAWTASS